jgi:hypothetical protein
LTLLDEITARLVTMPEGEKAKLAATVAPLAAKMRFIPLPGPQTQAYLSEADVLLYGGQAGGGKSYLLMGLASQEHRSAIVFRRESAQTDGLEKSGKEIIGNAARFNGTDREWTWPDGRSLKLAGLQLPDDWMKHAGRERDLIGYDEAGEFQRQQVSSMLAWLRGPPGQRCRMVLASNPPRSADGYWMKDWFAPWLDLQYPNPAAPGELRWALMIDGIPSWVDGPGEYEVSGEIYTALSFTFIPAKLEDNPYRDTAEYRANLQSLEGPLRAQLLKGDFEAGMEDGAYQVIPTEWIKLAQERWTPQRPLGIPMCAMGVDVAQGGTDQTVIARRYDGWFAPLDAVPGSETPSGSEAAGKVLARRLDNAKVIVDVGGGWGADTLKHLIANGVDATGYMGIVESHRRDRNNVRRLFNVRTEAYWRFREALDPHQPGGSSIMLPPDRELLADLAAPTYEDITHKGQPAIKLISKEKLVKDLGRSPDRGDAVVMAWHAGERGMHDPADRRRTSTPGGRVPQVILAKGPRMTAGRRR